MKRQLVLTNEAAGHPLRRLMPPPPRPRAKPDDDRDGRLFVLSYAAFFVCFYTFIF